MKRINWLEFMKIRDNFLRLAILTAKGTDRRRLQRGLPQVFATTDRRPHVPLSAVRWALGLWGFDKKFIFNDEWLPEEILMFLGIRCKIIYRERPITKVDRRTLLDLRGTHVEREMKICHVKGHDWLVGGIFEEEVACGWLIPLDRVDLES